MKSSLSVQSISLNDHYSAHLVPNGLSSLQLGDIDEVAAGNVKTYDHDREEIEPVLIMHMMVVEHCVNHMNIRWLHVPHNKATTQHRSKHKVVKRNTC